MIMFGKDLCEPAVSTKGQPVVARKHTHPLPPLLPLLPETRQRSQEEVGAVTSLFFPLLRETESRRDDVLQAGSRLKSRVMAPRAPSPCQPPHACDLVD